MMPCPTPGGQVAPLLISLAVGYGVLVLAKREVKPLNRLGKFVGGLILLVAFVGLICIAVSRACKMCPTQRGGDRSVMCPFGGPKSACDLPAGVLPTEGAPAGGQ